MKHIPLLLIIVLLVSCNMGKSGKSQDNEKPVIAVTIEPQRYFTEAIAGDKFDVISIVPKGSSPETYDPTPQQTSAKPLTRVIIDKDLNFYAAFGSEKEHSLTLDELTPFLQSCAEREPEMFVALYADETVPYREIVKVLNIANENHFKMVLATRPPETNK